MPVLEPLWPVPVVAIQPGVDRFLAAANGLSYPEWRQTIENLRENHVALARAHFRMLDGKPVNLTRRLTPAHYVGNDHAPSTYI